jgi:hypothetical protein
LRSTACRCKLVVKEEQETDYEMYMADEHGLKMYLPIRYYDIFENTVIAAVNNFSRRYREARKASL